MTQEQYDLNFVVLRAQILHSNGTQFQNYSVPWLMLLPSWRKSGSSGSRWIIQVGLQAHSDLFLQTLRPLTMLDVMDVTNVGEPANKANNEKYGG